MINKKTISSVVTIALLLVVTVVVVIGFQGWHQTYSAGLLSDIETKSSDLSKVTIDDVIGDTLYILNSGLSNISLVDVKINSQACDISDNLNPGMNEIDLSPCNIDIDLGSQEVVLLMEDDILEKNIYTEISTIDSIIFTSFSDFFYGYDAFISSNFSDPTISNVNGGEIRIGENYHYNYNFLNISRRLNKFQVHDNLIYYIGSYEFGIIDTKNTFSPFDDVVVNFYNQDNIDSFPTYLNYFEVDFDEDLIYIHSSNNGLAVLDRKHTVSQADDEIIMIYNTTSTPSLSAIDNYWNIALDADNSLIYYPNRYSTETLSVIDMNNTPRDFSDDIIYTYPDNYKYEEISFDKDNDALYLGLNGQGLYIIHRNGTPNDISDDFTFRYTTTTTPALDDNDLDCFNYVGDTKFYLNNIQDNYLMFVDLNNTITDLSDDIITTSIDGSSIWQDLREHNQHDDFFHFDTSTGYLYFKNPVLGFVIVDTKNTSSFADDTVVEQYNTDSLPRQYTLNYDTYDYESMSYYFPETNIVYLRDELGITYFNLSNSYSNKSYATYISSVTFLGDLQIQKISWDEEKSPGQDINLKTRVINDSSIYYDSFDSEQSLSNIGTLYSWQESYVCNNHIIENDIFKMSNGSSVNGCDSSINLSTIYPKGSKVYARMKFVSSSSDYDDKWLYVYDNDWNSDASIDASDLTNWKILNFIAGEDIESIGFEMYCWPSIDVGDELWIDWVMIEPPNAWDEWSEPYYYNASGNTLAHNMTNMSFLQYKINLYTNDTILSPVVSSVTISE